MKIDRRLNIVLELELSNGRPAHVHSTPVSAQVCEAHFMFISVAMTRLYSKLGPNPAACSRVCYYMMKDMIAKEPEYRGVDESFLQEVWRLTMVAVPGERGWQTVPFYECLAGKYLSPEDVKEVQNYICFFTAASWLHPPREMVGMYEYFRSYGAVITSSSCTEHFNSLPISTPDGSTGASPAMQAEAWSPPS